MKKCLSSHLQMEYPLAIRCTVALAMVVPFPFAVGAQVLGRGVSWETIAIAGILSTNAMSIVAGRENAILKTIRCCVTDLLTHRRHRAVASRE